MRKNRLYAVAALTALAFICISMLNAYAVTIDGKRGRDEWTGSGCVYFIKADDESNCGITFASLLFVIDDESNRLYLAIEGITDKKVAPNGLSGIDLYFNDSGSISAYPDSSQNLFNTDYYSLESVFVYNETTGDYYCEMCVGMKLGVPASLRLGIRIYDGNGIASNYYTLILRTAAASTNAAEEGENAGEKSTSRTTTTTTTTVAAKTSTTKRVTTTAKKSVYTTVAYKPIDLFKTTSTTKSAASKTTKASKKDITTKTAKPNETVKGQSTAVEAVIAQNDTELTGAVSGDLTEEIGTLSAEEAVSENEALEAYKLTSRKKTIGIAVASALLTAAVIDVLVTGGFKKRKNAAAEKENDADEASDSQNE